MRRELQAMARLLFYLLHLMLALDTNSKKTPIVLHTHVHVRYPYVPNGSDKKGISVD